MGVLNIYDIMFALDVPAYIATWKWRVLKVAQGGNTGGGVWLPCYTGNMQSPVLLSVGNLVHCFVALISRWRSGVVNSEHIRFYFLNTFYYFPPVGRRSIVMTVFVWVSVCVFVCPRMFLYNYTSDQIFTKNFVHATYGMSSVLPFTGSAIWWTLRK